MTLDPLSMLFFFWAANNSRKGGGASAAKNKPPKPPKWPTPQSPPPIPAFQPRATAPATDANTATPLAQLHKAPPSLKPANAVETAKQAATAAVRKHTKSLLARQAASLNPFAKKKTPATSSALVSQLQTILTNHGTKIARDGLYGPRTASAWQALAKRKGLPTAITREGPKVAKVVTQTFEQLNVPPIP